MTSFVAVCCVLMATSVAGGEEKRAVSEDDAILSLINATHQDRIRLQISRNGAPVAAGWSQFLNSTFHFFDRNHDGYLDRAEAARVIPFPLPPASMGQSRKSRELVIDFQELDSDRNGKASLDEFQAWCRKKGFSPVVVIYEPTSAADLNVSRLLSKQLDTDTNGKLTSAELQQAPALLGKFDLNEDEFIDVGELLKSVNSAHPAGRSPGDTSGTSEPSDRISEDSTLQIAIGADHSVIVRGGNRSRTKVIDSKSQTGVNRVDGPELRWRAVVPARELLPDVASAGEFLVAQLKGAAVGGDSVSRKELVADPALKGLADLLTYADSNADDRLSVAELEAFVNLIQLGTQSQVSIHVTDLGHNLFPLLDTDGDGRLSVQELSQAAALPGFSESGGAPVPAQLQLELRGPAVKVWAGIPLPLKSSRTVNAKKRLAESSKTLPRWFEASDRNRDGVISPREFLGSPEAFQKLDADKNGVISGEEAAR